MPEEELTLELARSAQITRTGVVGLLGAADLNDVVKGCFVRVLLELENGTEDYRVGHVLRMENGAPYSGFTNDPAASTTQYLVLNLPGELRGINGTQFQLNSISNSQITAEELGDVSAAGWNITAEQLRAKASALQTRGIVARPRPNRAPPSSGSRGANGNATAVPVAPQGSAAHEPLGLTRKGGQRREDADNGSDELNEEQLHRLVMEELRENYQVFPTNPESMKTALLRTTERDVLEYIDQLRDAIRRNRSNCVVCMERPPTVISLPCKHEVLCRLCATQVKCCPACREVMVEIFEPLEI